MTAGPVPATGRTEAPSGAAAERRVTCDEVWRQLSKASFAVLAYTTPAGEPRSSGVVYATVGRRLYVAVAPDGWKARHIMNGQEVSLTVPIRKGGILTLLVPIPPATVSFRARAIVHPAGSLDVSSLPKAFADILPESRRASSCVLELVPQGRFLTYGVGVSLNEMRDPAVSGGHIPVS
jgi:Pyridoxamine 5'-phosphate oxidase